MIIGRRPLPLLSTKIILVLQAKTRIIIVEKNCRRSCSHVDDITIINNKSHYLFHNYQGIITESSSLAMDTLCLRWNWRSARAYDDHQRARRQRLRLRRRTQREPYGFVPTEERERENRPQSVERRTSNGADSDVYFGDLNELSSFVETATEMIKCTRNRRTMTRVQGFRQ